MNSITFQLQMITLLYKDELKIIEPVNEMTRNNRLWNEASERNQTTNDLELEINGIESK